MEQTDLEDAVCSRIPLFMKTIFRFTNLGRLNPGMVATTRRRWSLVREEVHLESRRESFERVRETRNQRVVEKKIWIRRAYTSHLPMSYSQPSANPQYLCLVLHYVLESVAI